MSLAERNVEQSTASVQLLADNPNRLDATITNDTEAGTLLLWFGSTAVGTLAPGESWPFPVDYTGLVCGVWDVAGWGHASVLEFDTVTAEDAPLPDTLRHIVPGWMPLYDPHADN